MKRLVLKLVVLLIAATPYAARGTTIVLFADDFSNGAPDAPVSLNAPDPVADPINNVITNNTSLSGTFMTGYPAGIRPWSFDNVDEDIPRGELGGTVRWGAVNATSNTIIPRIDLVDLDDFVAGKNFTISIDDLNPIVGGNGTSTNWAAINVFQPALPSNAGAGDVTLASTPLGILIRDNGNLLVGSFGAFGPSIVFDATPTSSPDKAYDVDLVVDNISGFGVGNSFDYEVFVNGSSVALGTVTGANTTRNIVGFETRGGNSSMGPVSISTTVVPEPATVGLVMAAVALGGGVLRRQNRRLRQIGNC